MDNTSFHLKYAPDQKLNVRLIENTDPKSIIRGNVGDLLTVLNDLAYIDVENDGIEYIRSTPEAMKLYKLTQFGLQYMMFTVSKLGDNVLLLKDYIKIQEDKKGKMAELIQQQEETLKRLRNKKKTLAEAEKQYSQIMKTLNIDPHLAESKENFSRNGGNVPSEGDSARALPNNIPKKSILKKKTEEGINDRPSTEPIRKQPEAEVTKTADKNQAPPEDFSSLKDKFADLPSAEKNEFRRFVIQESFGKAPPQFVDLSDIMNSQSIKESTDKLPGTKNVETANKQKNSNIKIEDQEKEEGEIYEDDYEDDFELSQSQVKSQFLQKSSQLRESKGEFNGDETASFDVSTITQKTFDGGYLEKLDRIVSKNKADVEVNLKDFSK